MKEGREVPVNELPAQRAARGESVRDFEFELAFDDDTTRNVVAHGTPLRDAQGGPRGAVHVLVDITERKRAEMDLTAAKAAAEEANRAKDDFLAVLSHELRTPLTPVKLAVAMLLDRTDLDPAAREMLEMVRRSVAMEARLIDDLLDVSRIARGKIELRKQRIDLSAVIDRAAEFCRSDIEAAGLRLQLKSESAGQVWVEADPARLQQVFWNLLKNAIKFTPHGGTIDVCCRLDGAHVVAEVRDSGIGMELEALQRVFNAFEQEQRSITRQFGGLGLGLAICKAIIEMHGGNIEAESRGRDQGATFRVRLPMAAPPCDKASGPSAARPADVRSLRVLLVEDHPMTAKMLEMVIGANGHTVQWAASIASALGLAGSMEFDLLISDLGLPDGSGHDLVCELRRRGCTLPGIALTGYGQESDILRSIEAGFAAHLTKPASREEIREAIAAVMSDGQASG
jgi:two-component system CheB/CheR fusion protein